MRLTLLLMLTILLGISIQAVASNIKKAPYPNPMVPTQTAAVASKSSFSPPAPSVGSAISAPSAPAVTVWPSLSKGGQAILFKAPSDPGTPIQLTLQGPSGAQVLSTSFSRGKHSGGYVWRLEDGSGSPVVGGVYSYVLRFKQQGQEVAAHGRVTVVR